MSEREARELATGHPDTQLHYRYAMRNLIPSDIQKRSIAIVKNADLCDALLQYRKYVSKI